MKPRQHADSCSIHSSAHSVSCANLVHLRGLVRPMQFQAEPVPVQVDLSRSALVVVDMQNDFCHPRGWFSLSGTDVAYARALIPVLRAVMTSARHQAMPVIHLHWGVRPDCLEMPLGNLRLATRFGARTGYGETPPGGLGPALVAGSWGGQAIAELAPEEGDIIVHKNRFSGFWHNELDAILRRLDISTLFFAGINTERCVLASMQDATFLGYDVLLIEDAAASPAPLASTQAAHELIRQIYGFTLCASDFIQPSGISNAPETHGD
ncbi:cysteine hydrolase [Marinobacter sp. M3C]|uniref:cysteine hydrolase family protein n=1 Tax=unclassified Marinobacter TaxID=83889 RepID=UPI00200C7F2A|nr:MULTISPECIES: isochorismatase family cysteine hydrolase [unclassified Marinobacter]MCL1479946.1 cysteine hydrolase [Marinobacter sp.]UQG57378.1 cysteine hydrolase [Marinobacter sp. M4C]UQG61449.1 cysteine hydrolase [Marinobacter sp. M3C]UQG66182.1 cysteine hydrolase [Marinobacter sp. M2C]UQG70462.1 cysteine hydrolase [Marinobacter sp. M1C]